MTDLILFALGLMITIVTMFAVVMVGLSEGRDPALNRYQDEKNVQ